MGRSSPQSLGGQTYMSWIPYSIKVELNALKQNSNTIIFVMKMTRNKDSDKYKVLMTEDGY